MATLNAIPQKSKDKYEVAYRRFMDYCQDKNSNYCTENIVLAYFSELCTKMKASTVCTTYSMLRATLTVKDDVDISKYQKVRALLKRHSSGYKAKKSKILSRDQMRQFILEAPDDTFLMIKVALIFSVNGGCRRQELTQMNLNDIEDLGSALLISLPNNKTKKRRSFIVNKNDLDVYRRYTAFRPTNYKSSRFFFKYNKGRGWRQVIGIHQFGRMPQIVANFLKLPNPKEYTGDCFRRSYVSVSMESGVNVL